MTLTLPDYTIVRELGTGGAAKVYLAVQNRLNRRVALKVLGRGLSIDRDFKERFLREARIVARMSHPHIVPIYDVGEHEDTLYMAIEYVGGGTLAERSDLTIGQALVCLRDIASALAYAHDEGFVHRDIKPDNILFRKNGAAMLADFGVARATESLTRMTLTGAIVGTPAYMSPEQVEGAALDGRADLYSLGVVLYELLCGHRPFAGESVMSVGLQHMTAPVPAMPPGCAPFSPIVERLLRKKPEERFASAEELRIELKRLISSRELQLEAPLSTLHTDEPPRSVALAEALASRAQVSETDRRRFGLGSVVATLAAIGALSGTGWWILRPAAPGAIAASPIVVDSSAKAASLIEELLQGTDELMVGLVDAKQGADGGYAVPLGTELDFNVTADSGGALMVVHLGADDAASLLYPDPSGNLLRLEPGEAMTVGRDIRLVAGEPMGQEWFVFVLGNSAWRPPAIAGMEPVGDWARRYPFGSVESAESAESAGQSFVRWLLGAAESAAFAGALVPVETVR